MKELTIGSDAPGERLFVLGNEAIGRGAIEAGVQVAEHELGVKLFEDCDNREVEAFRLTFEKRHPITHNLGVVDRKYLEKVRSGELKGREVPVTVEEIEGAIKFSSQVLQKLHSRLFTQS